MTYKHLFKATDRHPELMMESEEGLVTFFCGDDASHDYLQSDITYGLRFQRDILVVMEDGTEYVLGCDEFNYKIEKIEDRADPSRTRLHTKIIYNGGDYFVRPNNDYADAFGAGHDPID